MLNWVYTEFVYSTHIKLTTDNSKDRDKNRKKMIDYNLGFISMSQAICSIHYDSNLLTKITAEILEF